jgi:hypothetical protein
MVSNRSIGLGNFKLVNYPIEFNLRCRSFPSMCYKLSYLKCQLQWIAVNFNQIVLKFFK